MYMRVFGPLIELVTVLSVISIGGKTINYLNACRKYYKLQTLHLKSGQNTR
jgi:hypothetical protein